MEIRLERVRQPCLHVEKPNNIKIGRNAGGRNAKRYISNISRNYKCGSRKGGVAEFSTKPMVRLKLGPIGSFGGLRVG